VVEFARDNQVAQIFLSQSKTGVQEGLRSRKLIRQLESIRRLAPRRPGACRQGLSDQADAILETASALVTLDRRNLGAAWHSANTALAALPRPSNGSVSTRE